MTTVTAKLDDIVKKIVEDPGTEDYKIEVKGHIEYHKSLLFILYQLYKSHKKVCFLIHW